MKNYILFFLVLFFLIQFKLVASQVECNTMGGVCCNSCRGICCHPEAGVYCLGTAAVAGDCPDTEPPTYSKNMTSTTSAGSSCEFKLEWNDNYWLNNSGGYIFSTNNSGTWQNASWIAFTDTPQNATNVNILNSIPETVIAWCYYANDTSGNWNNTNCQSNNWFYLTTAETVKPTYSSDDSSSYGSSVPLGAPVNIFVKWDSNKMLSTVIFRDNSSGEWENVSFKYFSTNSEWYNTTFVTSPADNGKTICWNQWANDTDNNWDKSISHCFIVFSSSQVPPSESLFETALKAIGVSTTEISTKLVMLLLEFLGIVTLAIILVILLENVLEAI